jgi:hypothetical protein
MIRKIGLIILLQIALFGGFFTKYGFINIQTWENLSLYVDGKFKGTAGEGVTKLKLSEGNHKIKIEGYSKDDEWHYKLEKFIYIGEDIEKKITLIPKKYPTKKRISRIKSENIQRKIREKELKKEEIRLKKEAKLIFETNLNTIFTLGIYYIKIKEKNNIMKYKKQALKTYLIIKKKPFKFSDTLNIKGKDLMYKADINEKIMKSPKNTTLKPILIDNKFLLIKILERK